MANNLYAGNLMEIVDAFWEKRNLGVDAVSFHIKKEDAAENVFNIIDKCQKEYQTVIVEPTKSDIFLELQNRGFKFIECSLLMSTTSDKICIPASIKRFQNYMNYRPASIDETNMIRKIIENGEIFKTDKIALDPFFGVKKSGIRYSFWIEDLLANGNTMFVITFKDEIIGFELAGLSRDVKVGYLGGMLPCQTGKMLGAAIYLPGTTYWKERGAKKFEAMVSSNNPSIIRVYKSYGFNVIDCKYIFVKHLV